MGSVRYEDEKCPRCGEENCYAEYYYKTGEQYRHCPDCGISIDRDLNASLNIRNIGFNTDGQSGIYACGDGSIEPLLKQEKECLVN